MNLLLNKTVSIDLEKLIQSRMVILANSGGGKSYAIRRVAEQSIGKIQTIIIDPEGEFASLREKHDLILCGKDQDVPVEVRSASLLATKLFEINKSAVIDLYELHPQERQRFVKLFCEALVNAPKELYHPVLIILDEAHDYVPEGKPSEATYAVEALASKGRKRGQCLILASQRISKLSKNASAECNNKLIGRASQDIDYMRAGAELGFSKTESAVKLRSLKPGQFFAYGPAISDDVIELTIGEVKTTHTKVGYKSGGKIPPASDAIKRILGGLKDLPQEAEKELKTTKEKDAEIAKLKHLLLAKNGTIVEKKVIDQDAIYAAVKKAQAQIISISEAGRKNIFKMMHDRIDEIAKDRFTFEGIEIIADPKLKKGEWNIVGSHKSTFVPHDKNVVLKYPDGSEHIHSAQNIKENHDGSLTVGLDYKDMLKRADDIYTPMGKGERTILNAIAQYPEGISMEHIAILTGYKKTSRITYTNKLLAAGYVDRPEGMFVITGEGVAALGSDYKPLPTGLDLQRHLLETLPEGERKILATILVCHPGTATREFIQNDTGYKKTSVATYTQKLLARKVVESTPTGLKASDKLF